jgi:hypothetical protein
MLLFMITSDEECNSKAPHSAVFSPFFLLGPDISLGTLIFITVSLCFFHSVRLSKGKVSPLLLTQCCAGGKIETNEMGRACGAYGGG